MNQIIDAGSVHYRQWLTLTKTALIVDFRAIFMAGRKSTLELRVAAMVLKYVAFSTILAAGVSAPVWLIPDPAYSAAAVISVVMFFAAASGVAEQGSAILSPADASIVGSRPVSSRTFLAARLTSLLFYGTAQITSFAWLALISYALRHQPLPFAAFVVGLYAASTLTLLGLALLKLTLLAALWPAAIPRALGWVQFLLLLPIVALIPSMFSLAEIDWRALRFPEGWPGLAYPPAWFAALVQVAAASSTSAQRFAAMVPAGLLLATAIGIGLTSPGYLERLMALDSSSPPARRRSRRAVWRWLRGNETRAIAILMRGHLRSDAAIRAGVITSIVMSVLMPVCFFWAMRSSGQLLRGSAMMFATISANNSTARLRSLSYSASWAASWPLFAAPASQFRIVRAALRLLWTVDVLPTVGLIYALMSFWGLGGSRTLGQFVLIGLAAYAAMLVNAVRSPALPFSVRPLGPGKVPFSFPLLPGLVMAASVLLILLGGRHAAWLPLLLVPFAGAIVGFERLLRLRLERRPLFIEGEE